MLLSSASKSFASRRTGRQWQQKQHSVRGIAPVRPVVKVGAAPASPPEAPNKDKKESDMGPQVDKLIEELKKTGMTTAKAKEILKTWTEIGVKDPEELKKLLVKKNLAPVPTLALQALLDGVASFGGFYLGGLASAGEDFPFRIGLEVLGYFLGLYYFIQMLLDGTVIAGLLYTTYKYGTNSASLLAAVQSLAGPGTGLSIADKASRVVNIIKVVQALESVADMLQAEYKEVPKDNSLRNLGAYLTLAQAKDTLKFKPEDYGLTDKEAGNIAYAFATYDTNQNFKLEANELRTLCSALGNELDADETKEALKILDTNKDGYINFTEFVSWWVKKTNLGSTTPA